VNKLGIALVSSKVATITAEAVVADIRSGVTDTVEPMATTVSIIAGATADTVAKLDIETTTGITAASIGAIAIAGTGVASIKAIAGIGAAINIEATAGQAVAAQVAAAIIDLVVTVDLAITMPLPPSVLVSHRSHYILGRPSQRQLQQLTSQLMGSLVLLAYRLQSMHPLSFQRSCLGKFRLLLDKELHTVSFLQGTYPSKQGRLLFDLVHTLDSKRGQTTLDQ